MANNGHKPGVVDMDRMAPHSVEAEEAVLGSVLLDERAWFQIAGLLNADDFFIVRNGWVWEAMSRIKRRGEQIDNITVAEELRQQERLEGVGGPAYITYLINHTPSSIYTETYAGMVERSAIRRRLLGAAGEIARLAHEESADINETVGNSEEALYQATKRRGKRRDSRLASALLAHSDDLERRYDLNREGKITGVPSGFREVDQLLGGFQDGNYVLVAGRPGAGKTSWLLNIALNAARQGARVGVMSLEMSEKRLINRLISQDTGLNTVDLRNGSLSDTDWELYWEAQDRLSRLPILIDHTPAMQPLAMRALAHRWAGEYGLDLLILDYIGLMRVPGIRPDDRVALVTEASQICVQTCHELEIPFLVASQLSRDLEKRKDKRPILSDLRDSGALEQDADLVAFIYRDEMYDEATEYPNQADIIIAKHRDGPTGVVSLYFRKELTQFADLTKTNVDFAPYNDIPGKVNKPETVSPPQRDAPDWVK